METKTSAWRIRLLLMMHHLRRWAPNTACILVPSPLLIEINDPDIHLGLWKSHTAYHKSLCLSMVVRATNPHSLDKAMWTSNGLWPLNQRAVWLEKAHIGGTNTVPFLFIIFSLWLFGVGAQIYIVYPSKTHTYWARRQVVKWEDNWFDFPPIFDDFLSLSFVFCFFK